MAATDRLGPLVVLPNVGLAEDSGRLFMDIKAVEGLRLYAGLWPGPVRCLGRRVDPATIGYGQWYDPAELPFAVVALPADAGAADVAPHVADAALLLAGADSHHDLELPDALPTTPVAFIIEYALRTRLDILWVEARPALARARTLVWLVATERRRRRALARSAGVQANGTPAFEAYGREHRHGLLYFDTRLRQADFIGREGAGRKAAEVMAGRPLRLAFTGRLERMKGADQLIDVAVALAAKGVAFELDIFGDGSLRPDMARRIAQAGLGERVRLNRPVDFEAELVPLMKRQVDLFLCPHPQGDPSCTYLETLGCGVPIVGYRNPAFAGVLGLGRCGIGVSVGDAAGMADAVVRLDGDRALLAALIRGAAETAEPHLFEPVFARRVAHLREVAAAQSSRTA